jgi:hypothetical protein
MVATNKSTRDSRRSLSPNSLDVEVHPEVVIRTQTRLVVDASITQVSLPFVICAFQILVASDGYVRLANPSNTQKCTFINPNVSVSPKVLEVEFDYQRLCSGSMTSTP